MFNKQSQAAALKKAENGNTVALMRVCASGGNSACASLQAINNADLEHAYAFIEAHFPEITDRIGGLTTQGGIEHTRFNYTRSFNDARLGVTSENSGQITLAAGYTSRGALVNALAHELVHSGDNYVGRSITQIQDLVADGEYGARHSHAHQVGDSVQRFYEFFESHD